MSVHQRVKLPSDSQIARYKSTASLFFYTSMYGTLGIAGLFILYIVKSAMGIDLIPGWSLFH